jgi:acyl-CoA synthetase (AMP-forming)/AMP-acid ligase II
VKTRTGPISGARRSRGVAARSTRRTPARVNARRTIDTWRAASDDTWRGRLPEDGVAQGELLVKGPWITAGYWKGTHRARSALSPLDGAVGQRVAVRTGPHALALSPNPFHICTGTELTPSTSAPGLSSPLPHLHRD